MNPPLSNRKMTTITGTPAGRYVPEVYGYISKNRNGNFSWQSFFAEGLTALFNWPCASEDDFIGMVKKMLA